MEASAEDVALLNDAVREAGALAMTLFRQSLRNWRKSDGSQVTEADLAVDALLKERLAGARPGYGWLSEETADGGERLSRSHLWIADPIDGTSAFASGGGDWCVAVALAIGGKLAAGAAYKPVGEEFYEAARGKGARRNGQTIRIGARGALKGARICGTKAALSRLGPDVDGISASRVPIILRLCGVASGAYDGSVASGFKSDWDLAAGDIVVQEAGGTVVDLAGGPLVYNRREPWQAGYVAAGPALVGGLVKAMEA